MPGFSKQGAVDASFGLDIATLLSSQTQNLALTASGTMPAGAMTGAASVALVNTTATPGTITTRTAAQLYADLQAALGLQNINGFQYAFRLTHTGAGTLTLAAGTGVTFGTGTYTVATVTFRDFVVTVTSPNAITIQTTGTGTWS